MSAKVPVVMKKFLVPLLLAVGVASLLPALRFPLLADYPWKAGFDFEYPSFSAVDDKGNLYVVDRSLGRIRKVDTKGRLVYEIVGGSPQDGGFFYAAELAVDAEGNLFVLNQVLGPEGFVTKREEIVMFNHAGRFVRVVYSKTYRPDEITNHNVTRGRWVNLSVGERYVSWFELTDTGLIESRVNLETWRLQQGVVVEESWSAARISSAARLDDLTIAWVDRRGQVWLRENGREDRLLYEADAAADLSVPWWIRALNRNTLVVSDLTAGRFLEIGRDGRVGVYIDSKSIIAYTKDSFDYIYYTFAASPSGVMSTVNDLGVLTVPERGRVGSYQTGGSYPFWLLALRWLFWIGLVLVVALAVFGIRWVFLRVLKRRLPLAVKQLMVLVPLIILLLAVITGLVVNFLYRQVRDRTYEQLSQLVQNMARSIDTDDLEAIQKQSDIDSESYARVRDTLNAGLNYNRDPWNNHIYFALHRFHEEKIYTMMYLNDGVGVFHPFTYLNDPQNIYWTAARSGISTMTTADAWGSWILAVAPVKNQQGRVVALVEVGRDMFGYQQGLTADLKELVPLVIAGFALLIVAFVVFTWLILKPLRVLKEGVRQMSKGDWAIELDIRGHDEVSDLTAAFNTMSVYIRSYINEIIELSKGYQRFVPQQFLQHLKRDNVREVKLGDQVQQEMSVLFSDIRSFTTLSESMSPKENFDFLNRYLALVGPEIRKNNGFIDKYIGDAIMALYPHSAEEAVRSAIGIVLKLEEFNRAQRELSLQPIQVGIGIHTGSLMLGILGEEERMDGTVISDNVNLASRIEGLTKYFDASILITGSTYERIENLNRYVYRYLGLVRVQGKKEPIGIYEILDGLESERKAAKIASGRPLAEGIAAYQAGDFRAAAECFTQAMQEDPRDVTVQTYHKLNSRMVGQAKPEAWSGALVMAHK